MINFIIENWVELIGAILAVAYLFLSINGNVWLWFLGFGTSSFYLIIFYQNQLYADMGLQVYYLVVSVYGWIYWIGKGNLADKPKTNIETKSLKKSDWFKTVIIIALIQVVLYWILKAVPKYLNIPEAYFPLGDAFTTSASIVATWMLARKIIDNWLIWIVVNAFSMGMYVFKEMYITSVLFLIYTSMAVVGYYKWKKEMSVDSI